MAMTEDQLVDAIGQTCRRRTGNAHDKGVQDAVAVIRPRIDRADGGPAGAGRKPGVRGIFLRYQKEARRGVSAVDDRRLEVQAAWVEQPQIRGEPDAPNSGARACNSK